ncbi:hypothetical protein OBBRIDRAFT_791253 [Obba rivulosa]|uniref:Uncharacterized protein n=1 Tax=Obba rivulosa TaxID=1052685 RepID=A0A8E2DLF7_9APHY|nr:hypothetical protein OBBRIDRAFT_791253 [Obba rivulosa]
MSQTLTSGHSLAESLCELMASPHIVETSVAHGAFGELSGPIDLFSTHFEDMFMQDARGVIAGHPVDREGLKDGLLALQKRWNTQNVKINDDPERVSGSLLQVHGLLLTELEWTPSGSGTPEVVEAEASISHENGVRRIHVLALQGNRALFRSSS